MKIFLNLFTFTILLGMVMTSVSIADDLKNSLNSFMNTKDKQSTVNLGNINLNAKSRPSVNSFKSRSSKTVIATIDGHKIRKKEADAYLKKVSKGKVKDFDRLPKKQRKLLVQDLKRMYTIKNFKSRKPEAIVATVNSHEILKKDADAFLSNVTAGKVRDFDKLDQKQRLLLIQDMVRPLVINDAIQLDLTEEEKDVIYKQMWVEKQMATIEVSNEEMLAYYEKTKQQALAKNPQAVIPSYMSLGVQLKNQVIEKKMMSNLTKDMEIVIVDDLNTSMNSTDKIEKEKE